MNIQKLIMGTKIIKSMDELELVSLFFKGTESSLADDIAKEGSRSHPYFCYLKYYHMPFKAFRNY
jgi:hypothetical protein